MWSFQRGVSGQIALRLFTLLIYLCFGGCKDIEGCGGLGS